MIIFKLALHNLKANKKKNKIIFLAVLLTSVLLFSLGIGMSDYIENERAAVLNRVGSYHIALIDDYTILEKLQAKEEISDIFIVQTKDIISLEATEDERLYWEIERTYLNIINSDINYEDELKLATGKMPKNNQEIVISDSLSKRLNLSVGSTYEGYKIVGIYNNSKMLSENRTDYYAYTYDTLKELSEDTVFFITFKSLHNIYDQIYSIADELDYQYETTQWGERDYDNIQINVSLLATYGQYSEGEKQDAEFYLLIIISTILSLFCISIIYNSIMISVSDRKKELGVLRSTGATKTQIFKLVLTEMLMIALASIILAFILSIILVKVVILIISIILSSILTSPIIFAFNWLYVIVSLIFIIFISLISSIIPALKASITSPIEAIHNQEKFKINKSKENYPFIQKHFGYIGEYAYKNIKRQKAKFRTTIFSLSCCIILFVALSTLFRTNLKENTNKYWYEFDSVINLQTTDIDSQTAVINDLKNLNNYDEFTYYKNSVLSVKYIGEETESYKEYKESLKTRRTQAGITYEEPEYEYINLYALDDLTFQNYRKKLKALDKEYLFFSNEIYSMFKNDARNTKVYRFANEDFKIDLYAIKNTWNESENGVKIFTLDNFKLMSQEFYLNPSGITVVTNLDNYEKIMSSLSAVIPQEEYYDYYTIGMNSKNITELDTEIRSIINKYSNLEIDYSPNKIRYQETHLNNIATYFVIYSIIAFVSIVSIINSFNVINANMKVREKEFACLRSMGLDKKDLIKITNLESYFLHIHTLIYGLIGSIIAITLEVTYGSNYFTDNFVFPLPEIIISIIVMQIVISTIMKYCNKKISEQNIIETIRKDSL